MRVIYDEKHCKFLLGSRFLDKKFKTVCDYRVNVLKDTDLECGRSVSCTQLFEDKNSKDKNSYDVLAALLFLTEADPRLGNVMIKKDNGKYYIAKIDHDGRFMNLYHPQWTDLAHVAFRNFYMQKNSLDLNKLTDALEKIGKMPAKKINRDVDKHVHFLNSLGLDQWKDTNLKLPLMPDFAWENAQIYKRNLKKPKALGRSCCWKERN